MAASAADALASEEGEANEDRNPDAERTELEFVTDAEESSADEDDD